MWRFERSSDGAILFYPHGWGRGYVVPTESRRREIEEFLDLWLVRLRAAAGAGQWLMLLAVAIFVAGFVPLLCRATWSIASPLTVFRAGLFVGASAFLLMMISPLALRFLAETAKADLEKSTQRRPLSSFLRENAQRIDWRRLWIKAVASGFALFEAIWVLWPRRTTIMIPAHIAGLFLVFGLVLLFLGGGTTAFTLWQIRTKLQA